MFFCVLIINFCIYIIDFNPDITTLYVSSLCCVFLFDNLLLIVVSNTTDLFFLILFLGITIGKGHDKDTKTDEENPNAGKGHKQ